MLKLKLRKSYKILLGIGCLVVLTVLGFQILKIVIASPDSISSTFSDETKVGVGTEILTISGGQVTLAECYSPDPSWTKEADTIVRDISNLSDSDATTPKDIYCDDYNCLLWTDGAAAPTTPCIATDSNVYANILWSKTDVGGTLDWAAGSYFSITGGDVGGTHDSSLNAGSRTVGAVNWLARYYTSTNGTFDAQDACKAKGPGWRLPNILELDSIRDQAKGSAPYTRLPNILSEEYWSSSEYILQGSDKAVYMRFDDGETLGYYKDVAQDVRCVRGQ